MRKNMSTSQLVHVAEEPTNDDALVVPQGKNTNNNRYSLDSMTSFSLSPGDSSSMCELSGEGSIIQQESSLCGDLKSAVHAGRINFAASTAAAAGNPLVLATGCVNPIDGLYSMQASYFDV